MFYAFIVIYKAKVQLDVISVGIQVLLVFMLRNITVLWHIFYNMVLMVIF